MLAQAAEKHMGQAGKACCALLGLPSNVHPITMQVHDKLQAAAHCSSITDAQPTAVKAVDTASSAAGHMHITSWRANQLTGNP
jgi:hypothetical protein